MKFDNKLLNKNRDYINFWNAKNSYNELKNLIQDFSGGSIFKTSFESEKEYIETYCYRELIIKKAIDTCKLYCKAILEVNNKSCSELKNFHELFLDCYNILNSEQKKVLNNTPANYINIIDNFSPYMFEDDYLNTGDGLTMTNCFNAFVLKKYNSISNKMDKTDFEDKFLIAFAKILHQVSYDYTNVLEKDISSECRKLKKNNFIMF